MKNLHPLLQEQIKNALEDAPSAELHCLLDKISQAYNRQEQKAKDTEAQTAHLRGENTALKEELSKTNKELDRFVYSVSHDLRAPMTTLLGLLNVAEHEDNIDALHQYQVLMRNSVKRMDHFISNLLNYSSSKRLENVPELISLEELTEEVASSLRHLPNAFSIDFITDFDTLAPVRTDLHKFKIILSNLLSNAVLFHNIEQERPFIRLKLKSSPTDLHLTIEDNGQGIEEEYHQKIFNMFFRGNKKSTGNGLGLYIVKETVEKLNGQISFESTLGQGTTFKVELPNQLSETPEA